MKKVLKMFLWAAVVFCGTGVMVRGQMPAVASNEGQKVEKTGKASDEKRVQIAKLRGKLLYKRSQIRKLEKEASSKDTALADKIATLEQQRRDQFEAAQPKLKDLYAEEAALELEIDNLSAARN